MLTSTLHSHQHSSSIASPPAHRLRALPANLYTIICRVLSASNTNASRVTITTSALFLLRPAAVLPWAGIGHHMAAEFFARGCIVYATARKMESLSALPEGVHMLYCDILHRESIKAAVDQVARSDQEYASRF